MKSMFGAFSVMALVCLASAASATEERPSAAPKGVVVPVLAPVVEAPVALMAGGQGCDVCLSVEKPAPVALPAAKEHQGDNGPSSCTEDRKVARPES